LRIGILPEEPPPADYSDYVLRRFKRKERPILEEVLDRSIAAIDIVMSDGIEQAMSLYN
jgi:peptidyl-tRNA hydrolase